MGFTPPDVEPEDKSKLAPGCLYRWPEHYEGGFSFYGLATPLIGGKTVAVLSGVSGRLINQLLYVEYERFIEEFIRV